MIPWPAHKFVPLSLTPSTCVRCGRTRQGGNHVDAPQPRDVEEQRAEAKKVYEQGKHTIVLDAYEIANLRELLKACGYPARDDQDRAVPRNPFMAANTGDWLGQIALKLPKVDHSPNMEASTMIENARRYYSPFSVTDRATRVVLLDGLDRLHTGLAREVKERLLATRCEACEGNGYAPYVGGDDDEVPCGRCGGTGFKQ